MLETAPGSARATRASHIASDAFGYVLDGRAAQADLTSRQPHNSPEASARRLLDRSTGAGLIKWRLRNVLAYIEAHLEERITLGCLAGAAGLSRMHFAAQFRLATGLSPHAYLTRRRIAQAQALLIETDLPLVEVALSVGFQTQAHFTTVFRQSVGWTPGQWRQWKRDSAANAASGQCNADREATSFSGRAEAAVRRAQAVG